MRDQSPAHCGGIHALNADHITQGRQLFEAGKASAPKEVGFNAMLSTRFEKSFGIRSAEFTQGHTAGMTGMDRWIDWDEAFLGKITAMAEQMGLSRSSFKAFNLSPETGKRAKAARHLCVSHVLPTPRESGFYS